MHMVLSGKGVEKELFINALGNLYMSLFDIDAAALEAFENDDNLSEVAHLLMYVKVFLTEEMYKAEEGILSDTTSSIKVYEELKSILLRVEIDKRCYYINNALKDIEELFSIMKNYMTKAS